MQERALADRADPRRPWPACGDRSRRLPGYPQAQRSPQLLYVFYICTDKDDAADTGDGAAEAAGSSASRSPRILLLLGERPAHGYDLLERLPAVTGEDRVDVGNLYRVLRTLEEQGLVTSEWDESVPGPAKRTYELTEAGREGLERWAAALAETRDRIDRYLDRHKEPRSGSL